MMYNVYNMIDCGGGGSEGRRRLDVQYGMPGSGACHKWDVERLNSSWKAPGQRHKDSHGVRARNA